MIGPSNFPIPNQVQKVKVMDRDDMDQVIADFVDAAKRCQRAGFDFILMQAAHGQQSRYSIMW